MNLEKVQGYLQLYKDNFEELHRREWYKWRAVKTFQDHWNDSASDFAKMFDEAVANTGNLLAGPNEYSRDMIQFYITQDAEFVKSMFDELYDESTDLIDRITAFTKGASELREKFSKPEDSHYQTSRAIASYLTLRFPDKYYFYKTRMAKAYFEAIDYPIKLNQRSPSKFAVYYHACDLLRAEIEQDQELIAAHLNRLDKDEYYYDNSLHILAQDVIYAIAVHFPDMGIGLDGELASPSLQVKTWEKGDSKKVKHKSRKPSFKGAHVDFEGIQKNNKNIGDKGELWVMEVERQKLEVAELHNKAGKVEYVADTEGDGTGYDIRSYDAETGTEIFIEVKTTKGPWTTPFYITHNELLRSKLDSDKYRLYRVYDFNWEKQTGSIKEFKGDLESLCQEPTQYIINPEG